MRPVQVGPGRNNYVPKRDAGKLAAAADTKGFRMTVRISPGLTTRSTSLAPGAVRSL